MISGFVVYVALVLARVGAFAAVAPPFAGRVPRLVSVGLAVSLTAFYVGTVGPAWDPGFAERAGEIHPVRYALALAREALIGAAMGFVFGLFLLPARVAGEFVTVQIGLNGGASPGATGSDPAGPITHVFETAAALVFLAADGHHVLLIALQASFTILPLGGWAVPDARPMVDGLSGAYEMGLLIAGPLALCVFLLAVTMAVMSRAAPQLSIYSIGFALQVIVVLVAGLFLVPDIVGVMQISIGRTAQSVPHMMGG